MAKVRVHELAKELGITSVAAVHILQELGEFVRSASSTLEAAVVTRLRNEVERRRSSGGRITYPSLGSSADARLGGGGPTPGGPRPFRAPPRENLDRRPEFWRLETVASLLGKDPGDIIALLHGRTQIIGTRPESLVGPSIISKICAFYHADPDKLLASLRDIPNGTAVSSQTANEVDEPRLLQENELTMLAPGLFTVLTIDSPSTAVTDDQKGTPSSNSREKSAGGQSHGPVGTEGVSPDRSPRESGHQGIPGKAEQTLSEGYKEFAQGETGITFRDLLCPYLVGAEHITITDPYIRMFHQARNLMELLLEILELGDGLSPVKVDLRTHRDSRVDPERPHAQEKYLEGIRDSFVPTRISFSYFSTPSFTPAASLRTPGGR